MTPELRLKLPPTESAASQKLGMAIAQGRFLPQAAFHFDNARLRQKALATRSYDREKIGAWLRETLPEPTPAQNENLRAAASQDSLFIITGQQPGLLGGPFLAYLKALSAVALAKTQSAALGLPVIPIFWVAGDDSDLAEANLAEFLWEQKKPGEAYPPLRLPFAEPYRKLPVGDRPLTREAFEALLAGLPSSWPSFCREAIAQAYSQAHSQANTQGAADKPSLVTGFIALLQKALGHTGLLFVDANSPHLRDLTQKPLREIMGRSPAFFAALKQGEQALQASLGIKPQIVLPPGVLPGFKRVQGERVRIANLDLQGDAPTLSQTLSQTETLQHDALTRMVAAEAVMPLLGHVLGPAEMRYAAQLAEVFAVFTGGMPLLHPRQSVLLVPDGLAITLDAHGMPPEAWPNLTPSAWRAHLRQRLWRASDASLNPPSAWFGAWRDQANAWVARHAGDLPMPAFERRLLSQLQHLELSVQEKLASRLSPYRDATSLLRPLACGAGQDRHLNLMSVWAALDGQGLRTLEAALDPLFTGTQIFTLAS